MFHTMHFKPKLWTPANTTTAAWYDAADAATITSSGGAVSQWNDKSGNNRHATQGTGSAQPTYTANALNALPVIAFDGSTDFLAISGTFAARDCFMVLNCTDGTNFDGWNWPFGGWTSGSTKDAIWFAWSGAKDISAVTGLMYINGATSGTDKMSFDPLSSYKIIGSDRSVATASRSDFKICKGDNYWGGRVAELVVFAGALSTEDRQKMEGYLAWKWALTGSLPAANPYRYNPPYV